MGISYSTWAAYGLADTYDDSDDLPDAIDGLDPYESEVDDWLASNDMPDLAFEVGGDQWTGPRTWVIYVKGSRVKNLSRHDVRLITTLRADLTQSHFDQLDKAAQLFKKSSADIGWMLLMDVS